MTNHQFTCPECGHAVGVSAPVREAKLEHGCPLCGAPVTSTHFDAESAIG